MGFGVALFAVFPACFGGFFRVLFRSARYRMDGFKVVEVVCSALPYCDDVVCLVGSGSAADVALAVVACEDCGSALSPVVWFGGVAW